MNFLRRSWSALWMWIVGMFSGAAVKATGSWWDVAFTIALGITFWWFADRLIRRKHA